MSITNQPVAFPKAICENEMIAWLLDQFVCEADIDKTPFSLMAWADLMKQGLVDVFKTPAGYKDPSGDLVLRGIVRIKTDASPESLTIFGERAKVDFFDNISVSEIAPSPAVLDNPTINQGRGAVIKWKYLSFRSEHEVVIASSFDALGVMFFPNAAVRLTENGKRVTKEVDFLVCKNGRWGILEVDGSQHRESRAEDMMRDDAFTDAGVWFIRRYPASVCIQKSEWVVQDFISRLDAYYLRLK
jgi:hypothetical protein